MADFQPQRIALLFAGGSLIFHLVAALYTEDTGTTASMSFAVELFFFIGVSGLCTLASPFIGSFKVFATLHSIRVLSIIVALSIISGKSPESYLLLSIPFILETAIYCEVTPGAIVNAVFVAVGTTICLWGTLDAGVPEALARTGYTSLTLTIIAILGSMVVKFREQIVENMHHISNLNMAVQNLSSANRSFQLYADSVESESATRERNRITRELHDVAGYALTNIAMTMNAAKVLARENPAELPELFETTRCQAEEALQETRATLYRLRAVPDGKPRGIPAFIHLVRAFEGATGIKVEFNYGNLPFTMGSAIDEAIYRLIQEGLTNAFRHGKAQVVRVHLWDTAGRITVRIRDNGRGAQNIELGIGLRGMKERFVSLGGDITAENVVDGFEIRGEIPLTLERGNCS